MAARKRKIEHDTFTRDRIKTTQLVNRLTNHALGKNKMASTQVTAAVAILRKSLPDLQSTALTNPDGSDLAVTHHVVMEYVKAK